MLNSAFPSDGCRSCNLLIIISDHLLSNFTKIRKFLLSYNAKPSIREVLLSLRLRAFALLCEIYFVVLGIFSFSR